MPRPHHIIPSPTKQDLLRFWSKVHVGKPDECWEWQAAKTRKGYGDFFLGSRTDGSATIFRAHRVAWTIANKRPIPLGMCVLHHCDNPPCQNPRHLFLGTDADNARDMCQKERDKSHTYPERQPRGEGILWAKFKERDIRDIRRSAARGISQTALARKWGVCRATIYYIVRRITWAHVA